MVQTQSFGAAVLTVIMIVYEANHQKVFVQNLSDPIEHRPGNSDAPIFFPSVEETRFGRTCRNRGKPAGRKTVRGPFAGMALPDGALWAAACQYITGSVEKELHPELEKLFKKHYRTAVNIGCAEGYLHCWIRVPPADSQCHRLRPRSSRSTILPEICTSQWFRQSSFSPGGLHASPTSERSQRISFAAVVRH